ncbi:MAG: transposase, partial [Acidobacteria bacterium]|nr:transposase [Acidobacteriota bacterium]
CDFFAASTDEDYFVHQQRVLKQMVVEWEEVWSGGKWVMDSMIFATAPGAHGLAEGRYKVCVLALWRDDVLWPMLWQFGDEHASDHTLGQSVIAAALEILGVRMKHLLVDRGFLDGEWIAGLYKRGVRVTIGLKEKMEAFVDLLGLSRLPETRWEEVAPPQNHAPIKPKREVTANTLASWESCRAPLSGCLVRDTYPEEVIYQARVTTAEQVTATEIYQDSADRWDIEELFMTLTRYWHFDDLPPSRRGVALAQVHFGMLAFTLLQLFYHEQGAGEVSVGPPRRLMPERELAVYAGPYFALLRPSELMEIIFDNLKAWQANESQWRKALRLCEGSSP